MSLCFFLCKNCAVTVQLSSYRLEKDYLIGKCSNCGLEIQHNIKSTIKFPKKLNIAGTQQSPNVRVPATSHNEPRF